MATRTTAELVRGVNLDVEDDVDLTPFMQAANELVTEKCTNSGYSESRLQMIETWLAAHFVAISDPQVSTEGVEGANEQFQRKVDLGLRATTYGQQAIRLDTAGNLAVLDNTLDKVTSPVDAAGVKKKITWLGTPRYG